MSARTAASLLAALFVLAAAPPALAACPQTSVADIEDEVMCPVCGVPLALATEAPQAQRQREFVLRMVEDCRSEAEIKRALVEEFGPRVLAVPAASGFDLAAWLVPIGGGLLATLLVVLLALRWRRGPGDDLDEPPPNVARDDAERLEAEESASVEDETRLDADLRRYDL